MSSPSDETSINLHLETTECILCEVYRMVKSISRDLEEIKVNLSIYKSEIAENKTKLDVIIENQQAFVRN
jgi:hypothetical protein